ncbi:MAG: DUF4491 family protein [Dehalococcoidia bacterium]|nr:DUF4491 family protein [Dehalococcoidia bacterium]
MNINGAVIGLATFAIIGVFHPVVIKTEYYFGARFWPVFLLAGIAGITGSLFVENTIISALLGVFGFSALWSIRELHEQTRRVEKGWFPKKPSR